MTDKDTPPGKTSNPPNSPTALRQRAEALFLERRSHEPTPLETHSPAELERMLYELQVYQIELEMQNEEMHRSQDEMDISRARYFDLYDLAPVGYLTVCEAGLIREGNFEAAGLLGVSRQALIKQPFTRFIPVHFQDHYDLLRKKLLDTRLPQTAELRMLGRKNKPFWAHLEISLAEDASGLPEFRVILTNIAERKRAEDARSEMENFSTSVIHSMQDGFSVLDLDGVAVDVNPALCAMTGFSREELVGVGPPHPYWPPESLAKIQAALSETMKSDIKQFELTFMRKNGDRFPVIVSPFPVKNRDGETVNFAATVKDITERKQAEEALKESDAFQRDTLNSLSAHIAVLDKNGRILKVNEPWLQFARINGNPRLDKVGEGADYFEASGYAVKDREPYAIAAIVGIKSVLAGTQERFSQEYPCDSPDCKRWFSMEVLQPRGGAFGAIVVHTDISERKRAEEGLRDANQKLRLHFEQTPMAVIEWDLDSRVNQWNPAAKTIFGYSRDEALGQHASFILPPAIRPLVDEIFQALLKKSGGERSTNANVSKDGTPILCEWYNTPLIDEFGTVAGFASVVMDITEQTESLELLAWEKNALEWIGGIAPLHEVLDQLMLSLEKQLPGSICSVLLLDEDGIHLRHGSAPSLPDAYNRAVDGLAIGAVVGSCGTAAFYKRQVIVEDITTDPLWADYRELAAQFGLRACWSTPIFSHGKVLGTFAIYDRESRRPSAAELELVERAVHVVRLAIKRRLAEEEIHRLNADLERRVEERTAELETANKELEAFTYSVSHDLRAPLRAVDGFSRMVIEDCAADLDADGQRMLGVIRSETQRMGRLIDDLLAFSRLGRLPIKPLPIDMHCLAQETFDELTAREPERKFQLDLHPLALAQGSEALIRQVWVNLLSNALKFTKQRDVCEIEIGTQQGEEGETIYYVKDNGAGFDMRYSGKLFGIFQRLHSQEEFSGTGVGLALVQRIVHRHGGKIWTESELDLGAAFYFTLPNQKP